MKILVFGGSLRKGSFSSSIMRAAVKLAPSQAELEVVSLEGIPIYNSDFEAAFPAKAVELKAKIKAADAVLFVTPEYNFSIPGYLKNALDWVSRPYGTNALNEKPGAIISCSPGLLGGIRANYHLRQMMVELNVHLLNKPEVIIGGVSQKLDASGNLTDEETAKRIKELLEALVSWTRKLS